MANKVIEKIDKDIARFEEKKAGLLKKKAELNAQIADVDKSIEECKAKRDVENMKKVNELAVRAGYNTVEELLSALGDNLDDIMELVGTPAAPEDETSEAEDTDESEETEDEDDEADPFANYTED